LIEEVAITDLQKVTDKLYVSHNWQNEKAKGTKHYTENTQKKV